MKYLPVVALLFFTVCCTKYPSDIPAPKPGPESDDSAVCHQAAGAAFLYDNQAIPEFHVSVLLSEWNRLLKAYDNDINTDEYIYCDVHFKQDDEEIDIRSAGLRIKGNSSRVRPEGWTGQEHKSSNPQWNHSHFALNFHRFVKDEDHTIRGTRKVYLKFFHEDPCYVREIFCFDLFRRYGVWTAPLDKYCRLWIKVWGDEKESYFGVYQCQEYVNEDFIKVRADKFKSLGGSTKGNLWKCRWGSSLQKVNDDFNNDDDTKNHPYTLKTNNGNFNSAVRQLQDFIIRVNEPDSSVFNAWISQVTDVELLIRTIAVDVAVGSWDDYWCNHNNWYLYFDSTDETDYHFFYIPYDFDYTLGTCGDTYFQKDAGSKDPLKWGTCAYPLIYRILQIPRYRKYYIECLRELADISNPYINYNSAVPRILQWHSQIAPFVPNDTGQDCEIIDKPAAWGTQTWYRLLDTSPSVNFFRIKTASIDAIDE